MIDQSIANARMAKLGNAMRLLFMTERKSFNLAACHLWLWPPIRLEQIVYTTDREGLWTGFATWACLSPETGWRMIEEDPPFLELGEWNEGGDLWIMDLVAPFGNARSVARMMRDRLSGYHFSARRTVRRSDGSILGSRLIPICEKERGLQRR